MNAYGLWFESGRVCLDLTATATPRERLGSAAALRHWLLGAALVPPGTPMRAVDGDWLPPFWQLRADISELVKMQPHGPSVEAALARVNMLAGGALPEMRAVRGEDGSLVRELPGALRSGTMLALLARDALELLTDPVARGLLRCCAADGCARVYLDTSRGRRRRWCSSELCGNRERVARHRRRAASAPDAAPGPSSGSRGSARPALTARPPAPGPEPGVKPGPYGGTV
ncbi:CGNR zinc finger domain-containing protein [Streptomyces sp. NPDC006879]|uniref:CGNR zinc finger domain-containing protein n=1 Tax=Streptomyces sp. NPDC006879 TaxID=3364767 RepID=UPI003690742E